LSWIWHHFLWTGLDTYTESHLIKQWLVLTRKLLETLPTPAHSIMRIWIPCRLAKVWIWCNVLYNCSLVWWHSQLSMLLHALKWLALARYDLDPILCFCRSSYMSFLMPMVVIIQSIWSMLHYLLCLHTWLHGSFVAMMRKVDGWELAPKMGVACETLILLRLAEHHLCYLATSFGLLAWYCHAKSFIPLFMCNLIWNMEEE
jgi:hypothetical protein